LQDQRNIAVVGFDPSEVARLEVERERDAVTAELHYRHGGDLRAADLPVIGRQELDQGHDHCAVCRAVVGNHTGGQAIVDLLQEFVEYLPRHAEQRVVVGWIA